MQSLPACWFLGSNSPPIVSQSSKSRTLSLRLLWLQRLLQQIAQDAETFIHWRLAITLALVQIFAALRAQTGAGFFANGLHRQRQQQILAQRLAQIKLVILVNRENQFVIA